MRAFINWERVASRCQAFRGRGKGVRGETVLHRREGEVQTSNHLDGRACPLTSARKRKMRRGAGIEKASSVCLLALRSTRTNCEGRIDRI